MDVFIDIFKRVELELKSPKSYDNCFTDVDVFVEFTGPEGDAYRLRGFCDGSNIWKVRFTPCRAGKWSYRTYALPKDEALEQAGNLQVEPVIGQEKGFLRAYPGQNWGLRFDSGEELLVFGDTMYNLFGAAHCGVDIREVLQHRKDQGFNFLRVRMPVSPYHPGCPENVWQNRSTWLWGGSPQAPEYGKLNLEYFKTVDRVMELLQEMGLGVEVILEAWLFEAPFNDRGRFLPEYEEMYIRYVVSRYSAYSCVYMWCMANEYNLYLGTDMAVRENPIYEKYAVRLAGMIREADAHHHPIAVHNTGMKRTFKELFREAGEIDVLLFQDWGDMSTQKSKDMVTGIEDAIETQILGSNKVNIMAEYGYEIVPGSSMSPVWHKGLGPGHTRRGAWKALFTGVHLISGFENTWGNQFTVKNDPAGAKQLIHAKQFFTEVLDFKHFRRDQELPVKEWEQQKEKGERALCLSACDREQIVVYFPAGGECVLQLDTNRRYDAFWYDPINGSRSQDVTFALQEAGTVFRSPGGDDGEGNEKDWVLVLKKVGQG
jgi:hypothetical protein